MIIEPMTIDGKTIVLVHFDPREQPSGTPTKLVEALRDLLDVPVLPVVNGKPSPVAVGPKVMVANIDAPHMKEAIKKICRPTRLGEIIPLTEQEFDAITSDEIRVVG